VFQDAVADASEQGGANGAAATQSDRGEVVIASLDLAD
jgi:hypothetical protein